MMTKKKSDAHTYLLAIFILAANMDEVYPRQTFLNHHHKAAAMTEATGAGAGRLDWGKALGERGSNGAC